MLRDEKQALRRQLLKQRLDLGATACAAASAALCRKLELWLPSLGLTAAFLYNPDPNRCELDPTSLAPMLRRCGIKVALPRVEPKRQLSYWLWTEATRFAPSAFGIQEPDPASTSPVAVDERTLVFVPALAIDRAGYRLGYGGGYFDRYLATVPTSWVVGLVDDPFLMEALPRDPWDVALPYVFTPTGLKP